MHQQIAAARSPIPGAGAGFELSTIRAELDEQRRLRTEQLGELTVETAEAAANADESRLQVAGLLRMAAESALAEIDAALGRVADGSYGTCERCIEPILLERLEVLPAASLCTRCQYITESGHARRRRLARTRA